jgi:hypothetical protein
MRRREFIGALGSVVFACPSIAIAQRAEQVRRVGWLGLGRPDPQSPYVDSEFRARGDGKSHAAAVADFSCRGAS